MDKLGVLRQSFCTLFWFSVLHPLCKLTNDASLRRLFTPLDIFLDIFTSPGELLQDFETNFKAWETARNGNSTGSGKIKKKPTTGSRNQDFEAANSSFFGPPNQLFQCVHLPHRTRPTTRKSSMPSLKEWSKDYENENVIRIVKQIVKLKDETSVFCLHLCLCQKVLQIPHPPGQWQCNHQPSQIVWRVVWFPPPKSSEKNRWKKNRMKKKHRLSEFFNSKAPRHSLRLRRGAHRFPRPASTSSPRRKGHLRKR